MFYDFFTKNIYFKRNICKVISKGFKLSITFHNKLIKRGKIREYKNIKPTYKYSYKKF